MYLVNQGASLDAANYAGLRPVEAACVGGNIDTVKFLLEKCVALHIAYYEHVSFFAYPVLFSIHTYTVHLRMYSPLPRSAAAAAAEPHAPSKAVAALTAPRPEPRGSSDGVPKASNGKISTRSEIVLGTAAPAAPGPSRVVPVRALPAPAARHVTEGPVRNRFASETSSQGVRTNAALVCFAARRIEKVARFWRWRESTGPHWDDPLLPFSKKLLPCFHS